MIVFDTLQHDANTLQNEMNKISFHPWRVTGYVQDIFVRNQIFLMLRFRVT